MGTTYSCRDRLRPQQVDRLRARPPCVDLVSAKLATHSRCSSLGPQPREPRLPQPVRQPLRLLLPAPDVGPPAVHTLPAQALSPQLPQSRDLHERGAQLHARHGCAVPTGGFASAAQPGVPTCQSLLLLDSGDGLISNVLGRDVHVRHRVVAQYLGRQAERPRYGRAERDGGRAQVHEDAPDPRAPVCVPFLSAYGITHPRICRTDGTPPGVCGMWLLPLRSPPLRT